MRILIIGGTGLISTPMTRDLAARGAEVTVYNRGRRSPDLPEGVHQMLGDRTDYSTFEAEMQRVEPFDVVIDMICYKPEDALSLTRAFVEAAGNSQTFGKSYHVTGEEWMTWNRIHEIVAMALGAPAPNLVHIPTALLARVAKRAFISEVNFQFNNIFDNSAAHQDLNFRYTIPFADGSSRVISWLDAHDKIENSDNDPYDDRIIAAWERHNERMSQDLQDING